MARLQLHSLVEGENCESARKELTQLQNALSVEKLEVIMCSNGSLDQGMGH